jgi:hypothetical protein
VKPVPELETDAEPGHKVEKCDILDSLLTLQPHKRAVLEGINPPGVIIHNIDFFEPMFPVILRIFWVRDRPRRVSMFVFISVNVTIKHIKEGLR